MVLPPALTPKSSPENVVAEPCSRGSADTPMSLASNDTTVPVKAWLAALPRGSRSPATDNWKFIPMMGLTDRDTCEPLTCNSARVGAAPFRRPS